MQALDVIKQYKEWHGDPTGNAMPDPAELGQAIDAAAESLKDTQHGDILTQYNAWRRDDGENSEDRLTMPEGANIAQALDAFISKCEADS